MIMALLCYNNGIVLLCISGGKESDVRQTLNGSSGRPKLNTLPGRALLTPEPHLSVRKSIIQMTTQRGALVTSNIHKR